MTAAILPPALRPGDTVSIVSPSWGGPGEVPARFERGVHALEAYGYRVRVMPNARGVDRWVSGSAAERAADLHQAFADDEVRGVLCTIGGNHSAAVLPLLDFDLIAAHPKVFAGYSDITSLHLAIHAMTGLVTFYGPAVMPSWGEPPEPFAETVDWWTRAVAAPRPVGTISSPGWYTEIISWTDDESTVRERRPAAPTRLLRDGSATGPLIAGCLPSYRHLPGTPWLPDFTGAVVHLETPEPPYTPEEVDADLTHLRNAGLLAAAAAVTVGRPLNFTDEQAGLLHELVLAATADYGYPVLVDLDCGHTDPMATLPIGVRATVDGRGLTVEDPAVR
ncbi:MAG TPA: S66 peptidase family protein [Mycobacteriales bacterium]|jgi:muramoyltetrapeptide carboxypeptidase|nr:S66 peptidase family protein [Mycobacteriales bacterium]